MARLTLQDFLQLGEEQKYSCQYLYDYILHSPSICHALDIPANAACPTTDDSVQELDINDDNSLILGYDQHFLPLLELLKDDQVPINSMELTGLDWFNVANRSSFRSTLSSFPHISILGLTSIKCTKYDIISLVSSMPTLTRLVFEDNQVEEYDVEVIHVPRGMSDLSVGELQSNLQGPELSRFSVTFNEGKFTILDLFAGCDSPASLRALDRLEIRGGKAGVVCDDEMVRRIRAFLSLLEFPLDDFSCGHFKIESSCLLNLGNVKSVSITIRLSNDSAETNAAVAWWTSNMNVIPTLNRLIAVLIELEIDMETLSSGSTPDWNRDIWAAFDQVLCRRDINLHRLVFRVRPLWELPSEGYNYGRYRIQEISGGLRLSGPRVQAVNGYSLKFGPLLWLPNSGVRGSEPSSTSFITAQKKLAILGLAQDGYSRYEDPTINSWNLKECAITHLPPASASLVILLVNKVSFHWNS